MSKREQAALSKSEQDRLLKAMWRLAEEKPVAEPGTYRRVLPHLIRLLMLGFVVAVAAATVGLIRHRRAGQPGASWWEGVAIEGIVLLCVLMIYVVLPVDLTTSQLAPDGMLRVVTLFRGQRYVRLDALVRVRAVKIRSRGASLFVWLRDSEGRLVVACFRDADGPSSALARAAEALAQRDPAAVTARARHHLGLQGAPGWRRRLADGAVTSLIVLATVVVFMSLGGTYMSLLE